MSCSCCGCNVKNVIKRGALYTNMKSQMKPLDLLLFKGDCFISKLIGNMEQIDVSTLKNDIFTHAGMVITSEIINEPLLAPGELYVFESTMSGKLGGNVGDIYGQTILGVQIRHLDEVMASYDQPNETAIAWCPLINNPFDDPTQKPELHQQMTLIYQQIHDRVWDMNCWDLLSALYSFMRPCRSCVDKTFHTSNWLFCSEMVALVYQKIGLFPAEVIPANVIPTDFIIPRESDPLPIIVNKMTYLTTLPHYSWQQTNEENILKATDLVEKGKITQMSDASSSHN